MQPLPENALTRSEFKFRDWLHEELRASPPMYRPESKAAR